MNKQPTSEDNSFSGSFFTKSESKQRACYLKTSSTSFYKNAYKNSLNSDAIKVMSNSSQLVIEVSFAVSLSLHTLFREVIPG